jgi:hypothetical protein
LFLQHMISHYGDVLWAPHSPNLTDLEFVSEDTQMVIFFMVGQQT